MPTREQMEKLASQAPLTTTQPAPDESPDDWWDAPARRARRSLARRRSVAATPIKGNYDEMNTDLLPTAYHEAGHAVVAWCLGLELQSINIRPGNERAGDIYLSRKWKSTFPGRGGHIRSSPRSGHHTGPISAIRCRLTGATCRERVGKAGRTLLVWGRGYQ
jgi:hypothetical protein